MKNEEYFNFLRSRTKELLTDAIEKVSQFLDFYNKHKVEKYIVLKQVFEEFFGGFDNNTTNWNTLATYESIIKKARQIFNKDFVKSQMEVKRDHGEMTKKRREELADIKKNILKAIAPEYNSHEIDQNNECSHIHLEENFLKNKKGKEVQVDPSDNENHVKDSNNPFMSKYNTKGAERLYLNHCYICKVKLKDGNIHPSYSRMCRPCGETCLYHRNVNLNLKDRIAVVTGGRVKIGYYTALKLLNSQCKVIVTSRFPKDALSRFKMESNYSIFKDNLFIYPLDLRMLNSIDKFVSYMHSNFPHIDILINNAAQTIRRPTNYYKYLLDVEGRPLEEGDDKIVINSEGSNMLQSSTENEGLKNNLIGPFKSDLTNLPLSVISSQIQLVKEKEDTVVNNLFGPDGQPIDLAQTSSWTMEMDQIHFIEFMEVQLINTWAPYYLCSKLKDLFTKSPFNDRYIVNVTSMEGKFQEEKTSKHPHTNMAKASLNMMTKTCAPYFKKSNIYMTSVDPGWVSMMHEYDKLIQTEERFEIMYTNIPLEEADGADRIVHPIVEGINNKQFFCGVLLKDFKITNW